MKGTAFFLAPRITRSARPPAALCAPSAAAGIPSGLWLEPRRFVTRAHARITQPQTADRTKRNIRSDENQQGGPPPAVSTQGHHRSAPPSQLPIATPADIEALPPKRAVGLPICGAEICSARFEQAPPQHPHPTSSRIIAAPRRSALCSPLSASGCYRAPH